MKIFIRREACTKNYVILETVLITNEIIIVRTAACTVKLSVAPSGELHEDIFAQDACEQYPDVQAQLNVYSPQAEEDGFFDRVRESAESLRSSILENQFARSLDAEALTITKDIRKTLIDVRDTLGKEATDVAHQCIFLKHSIENFPRKVAEEVQTAEKSFLITTYKAADVVKEGVVTILCNGFSFRIFGHKRIIALNVLREKLR